MLRLTLFFRQVYEKIGLKAVVDGLLLWRRVAIKTFPPPEAGSRPGIFGRGLWQPATNLWQLPKHLRQFAGTLAEILAGCRKLPASICLPVQNNR